MMGCCILVDVECTVVVDTCSSTPSADITPTIQVVVCSAAILFQALHMCHWDPRGYLLFQILLLKTFSGIVAVTPGAKGYLPSERRPIAVSDAFLVHHFHLICTMGARQCWNYDSDWAC
jgi:hypothetical protein